MLRYNSDGSGSAKKGVFDGVTRTRTTAAAGAAAVCNGFANVAAAAAGAAAVCNGFANAAVSPPCDANLEECNVTDNSF